MKKFLLIAASAAVLLTGCQKNESVAPNDGGQEISFQSYTGRELTKSDNPLGDVASINVAAYYRSSSGTASTSDQSVYYASQAYTWSTDKFVSSPVHYWPTSGVLDFYACTSVTAGQSVTFTANGTTDFRAAKLEDQAKTSSSVSLPFGHKLTRVSFSVKGDPGDLKYTITSLTLKAYNTATYSWGVGTAESWGSQTDGTQTYTIISSESPMSFNEGSTPTSRKVPSDDNPTYTYCIPIQPSAANSVELSVTYDVKTTDGNTVIQAEKTVTTDLTNSVSVNWGINRSVLYNLTLKSATSSHAIEFSATNELWGGDSSTNISVGN